LPRLRAVLVILSAVMFYTKDNRPTHSQGSLSMCTMTTNAAEPTEVLLRACLLFRPRSVFGVLVAIINALVWMTEPEGEPAPP
jgi:hypothetical protein